MSLSFLCYYYTYFACSFKFICISVPHTEIIIVKENLILQGVLIKKGKQIISNIVSHGHKKILCHQNIN